MSDDSREYKFKILLLGNNNVGKTSILYRLKNRTAEFVPTMPLTPRLNNNKNEQTDYMFKEIRVGNKVVKVLFLCSFFLHYFLVSNMGLQFQRVKPTPCFFF